MNYVKGDCVGYQWRMKMFFSRGAKNSGGPLVCPQGIAA